MIERDDWARLDALLGEALDRPEGERAAFLDEACGDDRERRQRLLELLELAADTDTRLRAGGALEGPLFEDLAAELGETPRAPLADPRSLGRFAVRGVLGEGGMGRVYRALDPALGREVAIKAVARDFRDDAASLRRFEREARLLATLNHPNVAAIYGLEWIEGAPYLVLELVEGETLAERLRRGALPLGEALAIAVQVADALQEAHRSGIVHRDLKPANIKLGEAGRVKVLDFGIAKPLPLPTDEEPPSSPPEDPTTLPGTLLGTAPYMSPEQVRGLPVDTRSDVFSFGCVLYEMLTGRRAFRGGTTSDVLAAVLRDEPDLEALPPETPRGVRRLLRRCLRKDARDRQQDAGDARLELTEAATEDPPAAVPAARSWPAWVLGGLAIGALLAAGLVLRSAPRSPAGDRVMRLALELPSTILLADDYASPFDLSRDGSTLALVGREGSARRLFVRAVGQMTPVQLPGTQDAWQPTFAPDGRAVAFFADRKLRVARLGTGEVLTLAEIGGNPRGAAWAEGAEGGTIVLTPNQNSPLLRIRAHGGPLTPLTRLDEAKGEVSHRWPQAVAGTPFVLFTVALQDRPYDEARLEAVSLETGERRLVLEGGAHGRVLDSGHLLFARSGRLLAVPFDRHRLAVAGTPEVLVDGVRYDPQNGGTHMAVAGEGLLVYTPGPPTSSERGLALVDTAGLLDRVVEGQRRFRDPRLSPDGRRVAVVVDRTGGSDLWLLDLASGTLSQQTFGLSPRRPTWTPDGRGVTVGIPHRGGWRFVTVAVPDGRVGEPLLELAHRAFPNAWTPDGKLLVYQERLPASGWDLYGARLGPSGRLEAPQPLATTPAQEQSAELSPDGKLLAYESDELDAVFDVYLRALWDAGTRVRASTTGGRWPQFAQGGRLFFWQSSIPGGLRRFDYKTAGARIVVGAQSAVWERASEGEAAVSRKVLVRSNDANFDIHPDGSRFLMLEPGVVAPPPPFQRPVVVLRLTEELRALGNRRP